MCLSHINVGFVGMCAFNADQFLLNFFNCMWLSIVKYSFEGEIDGAVD